MSSAKDILRSRFSSEPNKYYRVALFDDLGFVRKRCQSCQGYFWTLDFGRETCPEQPCQQYEFLGNPPTSERFEYADGWGKIESFFRKNGHNSISRYPVVCRWRPDLYFTVASIVDFQRIESNKVVFEFPANPIIIPQMCLRFTDITNVGITGRHYTSFCMVGQHALANSNGYWKDRCIELDFKLLTEEFGIKKEEVVFKEDVWVGPGAFGNSLEFYVRGLELGNAVFTSFEGTPESFVEYSEKVVDMGAGLERFVWISKGTASSYDAVFPKIFSKIRNQAGIELPGQEFLERYFRLAGTIDAEEFHAGVEAVSQSFAGRLGVDEEDLKRKAALLQGTYSVVDHVRTLLFAISDGALPSNVGGGYNLRVVLRRALDFAAQMNLNIPLSEVALWHVDSLATMYPELKEHTEDIKTIMEFEAEKYNATRMRATKIIESLGKKKEKLNTEKLLQLYDSDGITPEALVTAGLADNVPANFYAKVTEIHMAQPREESAKGDFDVSGLPRTKLLFYTDSDKFSFTARVLKIIDDSYVVLDSTAFYARGGGQEPDHGTLNSLFVSDVIKFNDVVLHRVENPNANLKEGSEVEGIVESERRSLIMRHHTATHIVNGAARKIIGPWVWQHSAFKDIDKARLDITHFAHLNRDQILNIERLSNEIVRKNLPVTISWLPRTKAERLYGFRLYQGGAAPTKELRIVDIDGWDVEACGGTHCTSTGEIGVIKITKSERVQDGVERLEYVAGKAALEYLEKMESLLIESATKLETPVEKLSATISNLKHNEEFARRNAKQLGLRLAAVVAKEAQNESKKVAEDVKIFSSLLEEGFDSDFHLFVGESVISKEPSLVYVAVFNDTERTRIMVFSGKTAIQHGVNAGLLAKEIAKSLGGAGGGDSRFGQGGLDRLSTNVSISVEEIVKRMISKQP